MKNVTLMSALLVVVGGVEVLGLQACTAAQLHAVSAVSQSVLSDADKACVVLEVADAVYPPSEQAIAEACHLDANLLNAVHEYLPAALQANIARADRRIEAYRKAYPK